MAKDKKSNNVFVDNGYQPLNEGYQPVGEKRGYSASDEGGQDALSSLPTGGTAQSQGGVAKGSSQGATKKSSST